MKLLDLFRRRKCRVDKCNRTYFSNSPLTHVPVCEEHYIEHYRLHKEQEERQYQERYGEE